MPFSAILCYNEMNKSALHDASTSEGSMLKGLAHMSIIPATKRCSKCKRYLPATTEFFYTSGHSQKYNRFFRNPCKECRGVKGTRRHDVSIVDVGIAGCVGIPLTRGYVAIVDECDADLINRKWSASSRNADIYATSSNSREYLHRTIMQRILGRELTAIERVDHIHGNTLDNRRSELRLCSHTQNIRNAKLSKRNTSGYKGVSWDKRTKSWASAIRVNKKTIHLGRYSTPQEAHEAYKQAAIKYFGEFARFE